MKTPRYVLVLIASFFSLATFSTLVGTTGCQLDIPQPQPGPDPDPDPDPQPTVELPEVIVDNDVSLEISADVFVQNLTVEGNNFSLVGSDGTACDVDEGSTIIEGDVVIMGNDAEFHNIAFRGSIEVRGHNVRFIDCCLNGEPAITEPPVFGGDAALVRSTILGIPGSFVDTGPLPAEGGAIEDSLLEAEIPDALKVEVLNAAVVGAGKTSTAQASLANVDITVENTHITVGFVNAHARAECIDDAPQISGGFEVVDLVVNDEVLTVTTDVNQVFTIIDAEDNEVGQITVNEQIGKVDGLFGEFEVNALHVEIFGFADIMLGHARASIECPEPVIIEVPGPAGDFVTAGGFIETEAAFANFGLAGGLREDGELFGHLTYIDHGTDVKIKATAITSYEVLDAATRRIEGECEVNGLPGETFIVEVADNGEPGVDDTFSISVSNGYEASGTLIGGNVQLHEKVVSE